MNKDSKLYFPSEWIYQFLRTPFSPKGPIQWQIKLDPLALLSVPFYSLSLKLLEKYDELGKIPVDSRGNFEPDFLKEMVISFAESQTLQADPDLSFQEDEWELLYAVHHVLRLSKLIQTENGYESLRKPGKRFLEQPDDTKLFYRLLKTFVLKTRWSHFDSIRDEVLGQSGFLFLMVLLQQYGHPFRPVSFYIRHYLELLFPHLMDQVKEGKLELKELMEPVFYRFFYRFATWFGLIQFGPFSESLIQNFQVTCMKTDFLDNLISHPTGLLNK